MNTTTTKGFTLSPRGFSLPSRKGFTLIELLVVVAIIGILAGIIITSLSNAREKARDARRDADIKTIQTALEIYYLDHGEYPDSENIGGVAGSNDFANSGNDSWEDLETIMGVTLPRDPVNFEPTGAQDWPAGGNKEFNYVYYSYAHPTAGMFKDCPLQGYALIYRHEQGDTPASQSPGVKRCDDGTTYQFGNGSITVGVSPRM